MEYKVVSAQYVSSMCAVCGRDNAWGFKGRFFNLENGDLYAVLNPLPEHQSYPGRVHGGVLCSILDECVGRAINSAPAIARGEEEALWGVTMHMSTKYRKPTPYDNGPLYCVTRITKKSSKFFDGIGYLYTQDGTLCIEGSARYLALPVEKIAEGGLHDEDWFPDPDPVPAAVEIPVYPAFKE